MKPRQLLGALVVCAAISLSWCFLIAVAQPAGVKVKPRTFDLPTNFRLPSFNWVEEDWTASDKPYLAIRARIDAQVKPLKKDDVKLRALLDLYAKNARSKKTDSQAQFAWAYAVFQARENGLSIPSGFGIPREISFAMAAPQSPHSYQYARMRFIMASWWQEMPQLVPLARRLLKRNPQDWYVQYHAVSNLFGRPNGEAQEALAIAQNMVKRYPKSANAQGRLATAYWGLFMVNRRKEDGDKAIVAMQRQMQLGKLTSDERAINEDLIQTIRKLQVKPNYLAG